MKSTLFGQTATAASASAVNYLPISSVASSSPNSVESTRLQVVPAAFTMSTFYVSLITAPAAGKSYTFTIRKNGADTAVTITISGTNTSGTDNTNSVTFNAGDTMSIGITPTGTPTTSAGILWNLVADSGNSTHFAPLMGGAQVTTNLSTIVASYSQLTGVSNGGATWSATEATQEIVCPTSGMINTLYIVSETAPGGTASFAYALVKNGTPQTLSATVSGAGTTANDTTHSVTVVAGDTLSIVATPTTTPTVGRNVWGLQFTPTNPGESFFGFGSTNTASTTAAQYEFPLSVGNNGWNSTETARQMAIGATTITALYGLLGTAPGGVATRTLLIRQNAASTVATVTFTGVTTTANITGQAVSIAQTDLISLQTTPTGTPVALIGGAHMGLLMYIAPPVPPATTISYITYTPPFLS